MKLHDSIFWLTLALLGLLIFGVIHAFGAPMPPVPKRPKAPLLSPKDAASRAVVALPAIVVPWINNKTLMWNGETNTGYVIESLSNLSSSWREVARITNSSKFQMNCTNVYEFYRIGAFRP